MPSSPEPTLHDVLAAIQRLDERTSSDIRQLSAHQTKMSEDIMQLREDQVDTLRAVQIFSTNVDKRFDEVDQKFQSIDQQFKAVDQQFKAVDQQFKSIDQRFDGIDRKLGAIDTRFERVETRVEGIETHMVTIETHMVTKEYLNEKLMALRSDLIQMATRTAKRLDQLIEELVAEKSLKRSVADRLLALAP